MATTPGFLTDWPWKNLGTFKYMILGPWALQSLYMATRNDGEEKDYMNLMIIPFMISRALHNQIWISFSRHRSSKGSNRIVDRSIEFDQVDRESNWDDQILLSGIVIYLFNTFISAASFLPAWRTDGIIITILLHVGPVEYLYYWLHRALHHHFLYSRYHSHHHSSIVTEPITSVIHPFAEHLAYFTLFAMPTLVTIFSGTASLVSLYGYITYIDLMNNMGHCNFELIPNWLFPVFPPLKYMMYTPSFHSLHHTRFRTNYSLFMPFYDYIHGTMDVTTDELYEKSLQRKEEFPDVVHLTHLTTPESIFHFRIGFASFASRPQNSSSWYMWPLTCWSVMLSFIYAHTFIAETNSFDKTKLQSWVIPRYSLQYSFKGQRSVIKGLIEEAILEAESRGAKVMSLGLLNQAAALNRGGELFIEEKLPKLKVKIVDGSSLAVAIVLNSIPQDTTEILFRGSLTKISYAIVSAVCHMGIKVATFYEHERLKLSSLPLSKVVLSNGYSQKIWIVGDGITKEEQKMAPKGTLFIPFSQFPPQKVRKNDCFYSHTPSMVAPPALQNLHSCENWLPRRVMSASRVAGIVHALEGWNVHECGNKALFDVDLVWNAALKHGFRLANTGNRVK